MKATPGGSSAFAMRAVRSGGCALAIFPLIRRLAVELPARRKLPVAVPEDFERPLAASVAIDHKIARTRNRNLDLIALFQLKRLDYGLRQADRQAFSYGQKTRSY